MFKPGPADAIDFAQLRRVLVIKLRHHGDVLLTTPVYAALKAAQPGVEIDALIYRETLPMLRFNPQLANVFTIDRDWKRSGLGTQLREEWGLLQRLRARRYDLVVHLTEHPRGAWLARLLRARFSVAPERLRADALWRGGFTHFFRNAALASPGSAFAHRHTVEQNLDALRRLGLEVADPPALCIVAGEEAEREADALLAQHGWARAAFVMIQPTSRWFFKTWPVARNVELIVALLKRQQQVLLSCAPDAREQAMVAAIVDGVCVAWGGLPPGLKQTPASMSLYQLTALIARAGMFIGIDSAPMHIAAAVGTPLVALFGPSSEANWGPWQAQHQLVTDDTYPCRPCGQDGCGGGKISDCLTHLPVARVLDAMNRLAGSA